MSRTRRGRHPRARATNWQGSVLVFGEGSVQGNDQEAICHLLPALRPQIAYRDQHGAKATVVARPMRRPVSFARSMQPDKKRRRLEEIRQVCAAQSQTGLPVVAVVVQRDSDAVDPTLTSRRELVEEMGRAGLTQPLAAVPVVDIECWWQGAPDALREAVPAWRTVAFKQGATDQGHHSKGLLKQLTARTGRAYQEADSAVIAAVMARRMLGSAHHRLSQPNASWKAFVEDVLALDL